MTRELPLLWLLTPRLTRPSTPGELARLPFIQLKNIPGPARACVPLSVAVHTFGLFSASWLLGPVTAMNERGSGGPDLMSWDAGPREAALCWTNVRAAGRRGCTDVHSRQRCTGFPPPKSSRWFHNAYSPLNPQVFSFDIYDLYLCHNKGKGPRPFGRMFSSNPHIPCEGGSTARWGPGGWEVWVPVALFTFRKPLPFRFETGENGTFPRRPCMPAAFHV